MSDLRPAGDARLDAVAHRIEWNLLGEHRDEFRPFRPRADRAHFTAKHVDQLRQLVDPRPPYEPADPGDPRIVDGRPRGFAVLFRVHRHAAEFEQREDLAAATDALLPIDDGTRALQSDKQRGEHDHRQRGNDQYSHHDEIERALDEAAQPVLPVAVAIDEPAG